MSSNKKMQKEEELLKKKKRTRLTILVSGVLIICFLGAMIYVGNQNARQYDPNGIDASVSGDGSLIVEKDLIKTGLNKVEFDGQEELLIYTDGSGEYRVAMDTCQDCFYMGSITYKLKEDQLHCSGCGSSVPLASMGTASWGGCQPLSIPESYRQDTDGAVVVPKEVLDFVNGMFFQWEIGNYDITLESYGM